MTAPLEAALRSGAQALGLELQGAQVAQLLDFMALLQKWNKVYNLTSVRDPQDMLTHHLLDSLAAVVPLQRHLAQTCANGAAGIALSPFGAESRGSSPASAELDGLKGCGVLPPAPRLGWGPAAPEAGALPGSAAGPGQQETAPLARLLDVGSGGGLPGVVFAICCPQLDVSCVDTVAKKAAFVQQAAATLKLPNLHGIHARVESLAGPFEVVSCRAFAALADFTAWSRPALAPGAVWLAMKGKHPAEEIAALPASVEVFHVEPLQVPGLQADRCIVWMRPRG